MFEARLINSNCPLSIQSRWVVTQSFHDGNRNGKRQTRNIGQERAHLPFPCRSVEKEDLDRLDDQAGSTYGRVGWAVTAWLSVRTTTQSTSCDRNLRITIRNTHGYES
jgi:hypothetical protein